MFVNEVLCDLKPSSPSHTLSDAGLGSVTSPNEKGARVDGFVEAGTDGVKCLLHSLQSSALGRLLGQVVLLKWVVQQMIQLERLVSAMNQDVIVVNQ